MGTARRRYLERQRPRDTREVVVIEGHEIGCEDFKRRASMPVMAAVDAMPPEWRRLVHEFGAEAHELFDNSVPQFSHQRAMTAAEARNRLERSLGRAI
ncbi:MAG TPA: hypothetical protein VHY10_16290 [Xanthobacteraceae bacterium]|nr:hypothetical protein [Xanthobacteraceae bacterium]